MRLQKIVDFSICEGHVWCWILGIVIAVFLRNFSNTPMRVQVYTKTHVTSRLEHLFKHWVVWILHAWVEVEASEANFFASNDGVLFSALELNDPVVLTTISTLLEVNNSIGVLHFEENFPPCRWIDEETDEGSSGLSGVEVVRVDVWMSEATKGEGVLDLLFPITDICEFFLTTDAAETWACWVLSVVMESKLVICSNKLFHSKGLSNFWCLNLMWSWAGREVELSTSCLYQE